MTYFRTHPPPEPPPKERNLVAVGMGCLVFIFIALLLVGAGKLFLDMWHDWQRDICASRFSQLETRFGGWWAGCQVLTDEGWIPVSNFRVFD